MVPFFPVLILLTDLRFIICTGAIEFIDLELHSQEVLQEIARLASPEGLILRIELKGMSPVDAASF